MGLLAVTPFCRPLFFPAKEKAWATTTVPDPPSSFQMLTMPAVGGSRSE